MFQLQTLCAIVLLLLAGCTTRPNIQPDIVFENVNVVPMNEETVLNERAVAVRDGKIVAIVDQSASAGIRAGQRIDGAGRYLISGPQLHADQLPSMEKVAAMLDRHVEQKFDVLKVHGDLPPDVYDALIQGARARGLRVTGHAQHLMPLSQSYAKMIRRLGRKPLRGILGGLVCTDAEVLAPLNEYVAGFTSVAGLSEWPTRSGRAADDIAVLEWWR